MSTLSDVAEVDISSSSNVLTTVPYNVPLILSTSARFLERVKFYSSLDALEDDDFVAADPEHQLLSRILSPHNRVSLVALGRLGNLPTQRFAVTPVLNNLQAYSLEVGLPGTTPSVVTVTSDEDATVVEIIGLLKAAIDALNLDITTSDQTTYLRIAVDQAGDNLHLKSLDRAHVRIAQDHDDPGVAEDLSAIQEYNGAWYAILNAFNSPAMGAAIAAWVQARADKAFIADDDATVAAQTVVAGATDLSAVIDAQSYDRSMAAVNEASDKFLGATWLGEMFTRDPGAGATWAWKTLTGQTASGWNDTELENIKARHANFYYTIAGSKRTFDGRVGGGEFFDTFPWGIDWLRNEVQVEIATLQFAADKIPMTQPGAEQIGAAIRRVLDRAVKRGLLASDPEPIVTVPDVSLLSPEDKAARTLPDVQAEATLARAIHKTRVRIRLV